jgi:hypothetical protein
MVTSLLDLLRGEYSLHRQPKTGQSGAWGGIIALRAKPRSKPDAPRTRDADRAHPTLKTLEFAAADGASFHGEPLTADQLAAVAG